MLMEDDTRASKLIRIENISIENLKNVKYGYLNFENKKKITKQAYWDCTDRMDPGKTALIDAFTAA